VVSLAFPFRPGSFLVLFRVGNRGPFPFAEKEPNNQRVHWIRQQVRTLFVAVKISAFVDSSVEKTLLDCEEWAASSR
jgi:hypothetical protein